ncbi:MAG: helix-hairpin-helix domain-containing protein [Angelakisella sp.]
MKTWFSRLFPPVLALILLLSATVMAAYLVPATPPTPIYRILNSKAAIMGTKEFLQLAAVNINTADKDTLMSIPGIGEKLSEQIIAYRKENGSFITMEALDKVNGIGKKTLRVLKEYAYVE